MILPILSFSWPKTDPKRLKKDIPKFLKLFKPEDRLLLVGTSRAPYECEMKGLTGAFQKIVLIPRPDYASRHREFENPKNLQDEP